MLTGKQLDDALALRPDGGCGKPRGIKMARPHSKPKLTFCRKIKFWVRVVPRRGAGKPTQVYHRVYRTKKAAKAACKPGDVAVDVIGFYPSRL